MYSPTLERFLQTDPIGYQAGINIYEYASDDPIDHEDPSGEFDCPDNSQCNSDTAAIKTAREAALEPVLGSRVSSPQGREIAASLDRLGTAHNVQLGQHDPNEVSISSAKTSVKYDFQLIGVDYQSPQRELTWLVSAMSAIERKALGAMDAILGAARREYNNKDPLLSRLEDDRAKSQRLASAAEEHKHVLDQRILRAGTASP